MPTILIVDDRKANRDYLTTLLVGSGYVVLEAADGEEALQSIRAHHPDLILADILMPRMDGYEFVRRMRSEPAIAHLPVIFVSAHYGATEARGLAEDCGVFYVLTKPVEPETILATVSRALHARKSRIVTGGSKDFDREHLQLLTDTLARKADELEEVNARLSALIELGSQVGTERDAKRLLTNFCGTAGEILRAPLSLVAIVDDITGELRHIVASGGDSRLVGRVSAPSVAGDLARRYMDSSQPRFIEPAGRNANRNGRDSDNGSADGRSDGKVVRVRALPPELDDLAPILAVPVATAQRSYGVICFFALPDPGEINGRVVALSASMGSVLAVAYENAMRYEQIESHAANLEGEVLSRRRAQEEAQRLNSELERRVAERTAELERSHTQLRQAERMAALGTLCTGLGHDMGNLLLPLRARVDAVRRLLDSDEAEPHLEAINECMKYLQSLTEGLRLLALDPVEEQGRGAATDLAAWREDVMPLLRSPLPSCIMLESQLPVDANAPKGAAARLGVRIGRHRLTQAVFNLVNNAADAMRNRPSGRIVIAAEPATDAKHGEVVHVSVIDNGPGMPEEVRKRAIEPFFTTKSREFSTGMGLSLVHGIVTGAGGKLLIDSALGRGTKVTLVLPAVKLEETTPGAGANLTAAVSIRDPRLRSLASSVLASRGYRIVRAAEKPKQANGGRSGAQAVAVSSPEVTLWVTDSADCAFEDVRRFLEGPVPGGAARRIGVVGPIDREWSALEAVHLGENPRPSEFCARLREIATVSPAGATESEPGRRSTVDVEARDGETTETQITDPAEA